MPEESTTPDLVELTRRSLEAGTLKQLDAGMRFFAADAVWEVSALGVLLQGVAAIRGFLADWLAAFAEFEMDLEEVRDIGNGVVLSVAWSNGLPLGGAPGGARLREVFAYVTAWTGGEISHVVVYTDIDEARAAAEQLAESRG